MQVIVFLNDAGTASVVTPVEEWVAKLGIEGIAAQAVPPLSVFVGDGTFYVCDDPEDEDYGEEFENGVREERPRPYKVVNASNVPEDREERNLWAKGLFE